ncbi:hypothetical protein [Aliiroseovarius crassostreae]|uniref:hypothetical protein n=1 Tax=Aliiroseovarius crassostreae TaxID=154981 RepID=UPI003C7E3736
MEGNERNLHELLEEACAESGNGANSIFELPSGDCCVVARSPAHAGRQFVHFVTFERGAQAAIIPALAGANQFDPDQVDAPAGAEFINSQLFILVQNNDALWSTQQYAS